jgi:hypothetical protein
VANEPLLPQLGKRRPAFLDVRVRVWPVDLVEVDRVHTEPPEARFSLTKDRIALQVVQDAAARSSYQRRLGEHVRTLVKAGKGAPHHLLGMPETVGGRGVDPVHPEFERPVDRLDRLLVLLWSPAELPATASDRPRAEPDTGDIQTGASELCGLELCKLLHCFLLCR